MLHSQDIPFSGPELSTYTMYICQLHKSLSSSLEYQIRHQYSYFCWRYWYRLTQQYLHLRQAPVLILLWVGCSIIWNLIEQNFWCSLSVSSSVDSPSLSDSSWNMCSSTWRTLECVRCDTQCPLAKKECGRGQSWGSKVTMVSLFQGVIPVFTSIGICKAWSMTVQWL